MEKYQIFISYRRDGGEHLAGRIEDRLSGLGYSVFLDVESMKAGRFDEQIYRAIDGCDVVLVILSEHALDRCVNEGDFVRMEIEYAMKLGKKIIPIMDRKFVFPQNLPESMKTLDRYHGLLPNSNYFQDFINQIVGLMKISPRSGGEYARYLDLKLYPQALALCEKAMMENPMNADLYLYASAALLAGKRPFLVDRGTIQKVENYLETAMLVCDRAIFHYLLAYIKLDFYKRKMLRTVPDYSVALGDAHTMGITEQDIEFLFGLLRVSRPEEM